MQAQEEQERAEEFQRKIDERRRQAFAREWERLDAELDHEARVLLEEHEARAREAFQEKLSAAHEERRLAEEALLTKEEEVHNALQGEREKKFDSRRREEEEMRRRSEEERKRKEEFARRRAEEEERRKGDHVRRKTDDEDRKHREEDSRHKAEADRRRREEELRRQEEVRRGKEEEERKRRDEEQRKKSEEAKRLAAEQQRKEEERSQKEEQRRKEEEERRQRMESQIAKARAFFAAGDFEHASVEVAKALVNDPMNVDALDLEAKIKEAETGEGGLPAELPQEGEEQPVVQQKPSLKSKQKPRKKKPTYMLGRKQPKAPSAKRSHLPVILGLSVTAVIAGVVLYFQLRTGVEPLQQTFTILPWGSSSNSLEEALLGSSLAEEVTERFERLPFPSVTGFATSYHLQARSADPERSVFQLGSMYALEGKVTLTGDTIAVALQLVDSLGQMAWSDGFIKSFERLPELPDEIASRLAVALGIPSSSRPESFTAPRAPRNSEAYQYYLRGLELRHRRTAQSQRNALALFEQAVQIDPKFAEAFAEASDILTTEYEEGWTPYDTAIARARKLAESAIAADPAVSRGYVALARALEIRKEYREALANVGNALDLSPSSVDAHRERGIILLKTGKAKEALAAFGEAVRLSPRDPSTLRTAGLAQQFLESSRQGMAWHQTALSFADDSSAYVVGPIADAIASDPDLLLRYSGQVIAACEHNIAFNADDYHSLYRLGRVKQLLGKSEEARKILMQAEGRLRERLKSEPKNSVALTYLALTLTRLGKFTDAVGVARRAIDLDPRNANVKYGVAQMYSLQMYSGRKKEIDPKKKEEGLKVLKQALMMHYRIDALTSADFFNMRTLPEYAELIRESAE